MFSVMPHQCNQPCYLLCLLEPWGFQTQFLLLCAFFWVIPRRLNFICQCCGTLCLFHLHKEVGVEWLGWDVLGYLYRKRFGLKISWANRKEGDRLGAGPSTEQVVEGNDPHGGHGWVCERDMAPVGVGHGSVEVKLLCFRWLSPFHLLLPTLRTLYVLTSGRSIVYILYHTRIMVTQFDRFFT